MKILKKEEKPKSEVELDIEIEPSELEPYLDRAAQAISQEKQIKGFRAGKAPREKIEQEFGWAALYQKALDLGLPRLYLNAMLEAKIDAIGRPQISIKKNGSWQPRPFSRASGHHAQD